MVRIAPIQEADERPRISDLFHDFLGAPCRACTRGRSLARRAKASRPALWSLRLPKVYLPLSIIETNRLGFGLAARTSSSSKCRTRSALLRPKEAAFLSTFASSEPGNRTVSTFGIRM